VSQANHGLMFVVVFTFAVKQVVFKAHKVL